MSDDFTQPGILVIVWYARTLLFGIPETTFGPKRLLDQNNFWTKMTFGPKQLKPFPGYYGSLPLPYHLFLFYDEML